jgi:tetratricopeptide (TPR) repeat protein
LAESNLDRARRQLLAGDVAGAISTLEQAEAAAREDPLKLQEVAGTYLQCGQHAGAARCYARAVELQPSNPDCLYNLATSKTAFGELDEAERLFTRAIQLNPRDCGAWLNRSILRRRTAETNHVQQLRDLQRQLPEDDPGRIQLCFALARELEDLQHYDEAFSFLQEGSHRRRLGMQYDIAEDETAMAAIVRCFDRGLLGAAAAGFASDRPIFILGLPRSGTTLADRIVSSHSLVDSLGEHTTLTLAIIRLAAADDMGNQASNDAGDPRPAGRKIDLIERSAQIDFRELGRQYCRALDGFGNPAPRLIDKTPLNFLYLGLIRLALPQARVIHLRRHPLDSCYAIYKTLFRAGYPFSYSLQEVGRYYLAYHRLMQHWRAVIPEAFLDVDYEQLVADPPGQTRRMLDYLGLAWEDACLQSHRRGGVAATASAAQVRQPIYSSSVGLWRHYARQLAPLADRLREHGIDVDAD